MLSKVEASARSSTERQLVKDGNPVQPALKTLIGVALIAAALAVRADGPAYPDAPRRPVTDVYHGSAVTEDYRWLEDTRAPEVGAWIAQQNALTRSTLDRLPNRPAILDELTELIGKAPTRRRDFRFTAGRLFALKSEPPANQPRLVMLTDPADPTSEKGVVDPNLINPKGSYQSMLVVPLALIRLGSTMTLSEAGSAGSASTTRRG